MISTQILVLQLSGAKEWRHCRTKRAASCTTYEDADLDDLACETVVLEPGDALFLPRGVVHGAVARSAAAVHLTIGLGELTERGRRRLVTCTQDGAGTACPGGYYGASGRYSASACNAGCDTGCTTDGWGTTCLLYTSPSPRDS